MLTLYSLRNAYGGVALMNGYSEFCYHECLQRVRSHECWQRVRSACLQRVRYHECLQRIRSHEYVLRVSGFMNVYNGGPCMC